MTVSSTELWQRISAEGLASPMLCRSWAGEVAKSLPPAETADGLKVLQQLIELGKLTKYQAKILAGQSNEPLKRGPWFVLSKIKQPVFQGWLEISKIDNSKGEQPPPHWARWLSAADMKQLQDSAPSLPRGIQQARVQADHLQLIEMPELLDGELLLRVAPVAGSVLTELFKINRPNADVALAIVEQVTKALAAMHRANVVHGRVLPDRIFWSDQSSATLVRDPISIWTATPELESSGVLAANLLQLPVGAFLAPEFLAPRQPPSMASDIYALGAVWWWLLTGNTPFTGKTTAAILGQAAQSKLDLQQLPDLPEPYRICLEHCLAKNPQARFSDATQFEQALSAAVRSVTRGKLPPPTTASQTAKAIGSAPIAEPPALPLSQSNLQTQPTANSETPSIAEVPTQAVREESLEPASAIQQPKGKPPIQSGPTKQPPKNVPENGPTEPLPTASQKTASTRAAIPAVTITPTEIITAEVPAQAVVVASADMSPTTVEPGTTAASQSSNVALPPKTNPVQKRPTPSATVQHPRAQSASTQPASTQPIPAQSSTVQDGAVPLSTVQDGALSQSTVQPSTVQPSTVSASSTPAVLTQAISAQAVPVTANTVEAVAVQPAAQTGPVIEPKEQFTQFKPLASNLAGATQTPLKRRTKRKSKAPLLIAAGLGFVAMLLGILKFSGALDSKPQANSGQLPPFVPPVVSAEPREVARDPLLDRFRLVDNTEVPWAPVYVPEPIPLDLMPPGAQWFVWLRPADLLAQERSKELLDALKSQFNFQMFDLLANSSAQPLEEIQSALIGFYSAASPEEMPALAMRIELKNPISIDQLKTNLGSVNAAKVGSAQLLTNDSGQTWFFGLNYDTKSISRFSTGPANLMKEAVELGESTAPLNTQLKLLHARSSSSYAVAMFGSPRYLFTEGRGLIKLLPERIVTQVQPLLGTESRAGLIQTSLSDKWYWELQLIAATDADSPRLVGRLSQNTDAAADQIEKWLVNETPHPYWRALAMRFPQMIRTWREHTRIGVEDGVVIANGYLPGTAANNLLIASWIASQQSATLAGSTPSIAAPSNPTSPPALTIEEYLNRPIRLSFDQEPIEKALALVGDEANTGIPVASQLRFELDGGAFEKAGITRNQQLREFRIESRPMRDALTEIAKRGNPVTTVKDTRETDQKLIWVVKDDPNQAGKKMISLTTRESAAAANIPLSSEFAAAQ
jgi:serine/threonine protein kinase